MAVGDHSFRIEGLNELERDLIRAVDEFPAATEDALKAIGKDFKKSAKKRANTELKPHTRKEGQENKAIKKKWGDKIVDDHIGMTEVIYNSARHFHLIENGHDLVIGDKLVGFVPGRHIMEKTRGEYENIVPERFESMVDEILGRNNL